MKTILKLLVATALLCIISFIETKAQSKNWPTKNDKEKQPDPWLLTGNSGTNLNTHFLGTTDNRALVFRTNNIARMWIANTGNVGIGTQVPTSKLEVEGGDAIINGITIGRGKGAIGTNTTVGDHALFSNTTGFNNTALGWNVLYNNITGTQNTGNGFYALFNNTTGGSNTASGLQALYYNTTGNNNTASGLSSLFHNTTGYLNTANGYQAMVNNTTGNFNIAGGAYSLNANTTGSYNTAVGFQSFKTGAAFTNSTALGANAAITAGNQVSLGDNNITSLFCMGAYAATTSMAPNMYVSPEGQIMRSTTGIGGGGWGLTGNAGTIDGTNFLGTTDDVPLNFMVNNQKAGKIDHKRFNTFYGYKVGNSNTTGSFNTAQGYQALSSNFSGGENTAVGGEALYQNTIGFLNTSIGFRTLWSNTTGESNTANGSMALFKNTTGSGNTAIGLGALFSNTTGSNNVANGLGALEKNATGIANVAIGLGSLRENTIGGYNTALGMQSLYSNTTGLLNTAIGLLALSNNTVGNNNTGVGHNADVSNNNFTNATAIGFDAIVSNSNKVRIGNNNVTVVESATGFWTISDGRFKSNITEEVKGLEFIKLLRPVSYNFDVNKFETFLTRNYPDSIKVSRKEMMNKSTSKLSTIRQSGFVAQEVEIAAKKSGYNFNGVHAPENPTDNYSISYEKLVVPLVKAVQELSTKNDALQSENEALKKRLDKIEQMLLDKSTTVETLTSARLEQNAPNPYKENTLINYYVPINTGRAVLNITDSKGALVKTFSLKEGKGQVLLQSGQLVAGTYQYSLYINGRLSDTRQMVIIK